MRPENWGMDVLSAIFVSIKRLEILVEEVTEELGDVGVDFWGEA